MIALIERNVPAELPTDLCTDWREWAKNHEFRPKNAKKPLLRGAFVATLRRLVRHGQTRRKGELNHSWQQVQ
jgi:hypothetical protein